MIIRSLRRRIKKANLDVVHKDRKVMVLDTFTDMVDVYDPDEGKIRKNPNLKCIETRRYKKMIEELSKKMEEREMGK